MTNWIESNKKNVYMILLVLFLLLFLFYFFMLRPLKLQEENQKQELNRINEDASFYEMQIAGLASQTFSEKEKLLLLGSVPSKPNVEEVIKDLERTELETGAVIDDITFSINANKLKNGENAQAHNEAQENPTSSWEHILSTETLNMLKEKLVDVDNLTVSYVEMVISVNGEAKDVHTFVDGLEKLKRIIHIQTYDYTINEERNNRLEGILTVRAFYSEDFAQLIEEDTTFELDYAFDPEKIKRYVEPVIETVNEAIDQPENDENSPNTNEINTNGLKGEEVIDNETKEVSWEKETGKDQPKSDSEKEPIKNDSNETSSEDIDPNVDRYRAPEMNDGGIKDGEPVFYVVQTGAYKSTKNLYVAIENLMKEGIYPRIIGNDLSFIYTATDSSKTSLTKIVETLKNEGFETYLKALPYNLTEDERETLLPKADQTVSTITEMVTNGIIKENHTITEEQLRSVQTYIKAYENQVRDVLSKNMSKERSKELQETLSILRQIQDRLQNNTPYGGIQSFWEVEGLILDFMLIFNGYVPTDLTE